MNQENIQDARVALVTGAARRIGAAIATHLHQAGFRVVIHAHTSLKDAHALAKKLNAQRDNSAIVSTANLCNPNAAELLISQSYAWASRLDLLVNNASMFTRNNEDWDEVFALNVKAPFTLSHAAFPKLVKTCGAIINITDIHAEQPLKDYSIYCQSKAALHMQTKSLACEFAPNVRVNAVAPGAIMWPENSNNLDDKIQQKIIKKTLLKRHGEPKYIAQAVLALTENTFITGQSLRVDGGRYYS